MPDQETLDLVTLGPFTGIDTRTAGPYADPRSAVVASNADTHRLGGALCTALGRSAFQQFLNIGPNNTLQNVAMYIVSPSRVIYVVQGQDGTTLYYDAKAAMFGSLGKLQPFTQAVQSNGILWLNNGTQIFFAPGSAPKIATWQYPMPDSTTFGYAVTLGPQGEGGLIAGRYSYAFVQKISIVNTDDTIRQYTTPNGSVASGQHADGSAIFPYQVNNPGPNKDGAYANQIAGTFAGLTPDGYPFVTEVYRYSSNSPAWFLLTTLSTNGIYLDTASDASISGNKQIIYNQDPPPTGSINGYQQNPIAGHQDRLWTMAVIKNANTNNFPQTQVWYTRPGESWSFDQVDAALLIEDEQTTLNNVGNLPVPYGDQPVGLCPLGSSLMVFRRQTTSLIYGANEATYQPLKIFADIGCVAPLSIIRCNALVFWLSAQGVYSFDGSNLNWISAKVYNLLQNQIGPNNWGSALGFYKDLTYCLSFPGTHMTLRYYLPTQEWDTLPYATPYAAFATGMPSDLSASPLSINHVVAVRANSQWLDFWQTGDTDLALAISGTYQGQESDSVAGQNAPQWQKAYTHICIEAPVQPGVKCDVTLYVNGVLQQTWEKINLGQGPQTSIIKRITGSPKGYTASLSVTLYNVPNATGPAIIYSAKVGGSPARAWIASSSMGNAA